MAWRPTGNVIEGMLDNTEAGRISGWLHFANYPHQVELNLAGDFAGALRGKRVRIGRKDRGPRPAEYMSGFNARQAGEVDAVEVLTEGTFHASWYGPDGRVCIELPAGGQVVLNLGP